MAQHNNAKQHNKQHTLQRNDQWRKAHAHAPKEAGWYPVNYVTLHPGIMFGQPGSFEKYWDAKAGIWRVAGPGTPQSAMGEHTEHAWQD